MTQSYFLRPRDGDEEEDPGSVMIPLDDMEAKHIRRVLNHVGWNKTRAANILKVSRPTLDRKIDKYLLKRE
ncbi:MAG: global DNA-binding transcriptional dual regulator Fis [Candidatus Hinthialibacteria bacterium OLB16]|nr:MAG: global DNA-binding transcriptional dual regulator Fis [Candidatus Hinthialibacteria bacterium OLB16]